MGSENMVSVENSDIKFKAGSVPAFMIEGLIGTAITQVYQQFNYFNTLYRCIRGSKANYRLP
jgi:hypothetical protein